MNQVHVIIISSYSNSPRNKNIYKIYEIYITHEKIITQPVAAASNHIRVHCTNKSQF
ncbi:hypothetical protein OIU76_005151 [Salix suchowensis]|nr:hypothetical protein OIU76_005151 [Salix suchowensis]